MGGNIEDAPAHIFSYIIQLCMSYSYFLLSQMYNTNPAIIAPNEPNCTALILFQPKKWLRTNTIAARTMMMMPKFFRNPFIIFIYLFLSLSYKSLQRNTIFSKCENKFAEIFTFLSMICVVIIFFKELSYLLEFIFMIIGNIVKKPIPLLNKHYI